MPEQEAVFEDGSSRMVAPETQLGEVHDQSLRPQNLEDYVCLLYTSDAADE